MADSTADFTKKILIDVEVKSEQIKQDIPVITSAIDKLNVAQAEAKKAGDTSSKAFIDNAQQLRQLKSELREANKYIDNVSKALNAETGSIQQNRAILSVVTSDYVKLGQAEGAVDNATIKLSVDVNNLTDTLKGQEKQIGQTYRNVGNYTDSINASVLASGKASQGMQTFTSGITEVRKGIGFLPQLIGGTTAQLGQFNAVGQVAFSSLSTAVTGFSAVIKDHQQLQNSLTKVTNEAVEAEKTLQIAIEANTIAQKQEAAGLITKKEAELAAIAVTEADAAVTETLVAATIAAEAATGGLTLALNIFKVALASTGIGLLIIALASLAEYFSNTNDGAKEFGVILARSGAAVDVLKGKVAELGREIFNYNDTVKKAGESQEQTFGTKAISMLKTFSLELVKTMQSITNPLNQSTGGNSYLDKIKAQAKTAADAAESFTRSQQALNIAKTEYDNTTRQELQNDLNVQRARIRNLHYTTDERQAAAEKAKEISKSIYDQDIKFANESLRITLGLNDLKRKAGVKIDKTAIAEAKGNVLRIQGQYQMEQEMLDAREARVDKQAERQLSKEEKARLDAEQIRKESIANELKDIYENYGDQVIAAQNHYDQEKTKLQKFLSEKLITQNEFNSVDAQLQKEHQANLSKIIEDFNKQDAERYKQASNDLANVYIQGIQNETDRSIAALKERDKEQSQQLDTQNAEHLKTIGQLDKEIANLDGAAKDEAEDRRENEMALIEINEQKRTALAKQTAVQIAAIQKNALDQENKLRDSNDVNAATKAFGANSSQVLDAKKQQLQDNYNAEVSAAGLSAAARLEIERKYLADVQALEDQARTNKVNTAVAFEQIVQSAVFDIFSQNQQATQQKAEADLQDRKSAELDNTSLTSTEKKLIEQKYQKQDLELKKKAFRDNQKLQAANILINGAVAVTAALALPPPADFIKIALIGATTAASLAKTLSAKPGFSEGGQFKSDGRGALLSGYSRRDNTNAYLRSGEAVVVSEAMRSPWARNLVSDINVQFGGRSFATPGHGGSRPGFAVGGIFTDGGNANRYYSSPVTDQNGLANSLAYQLINNFPPIVADIKDIISQQSIKMQTIDRVNL